MKKEAEVLAQFDGRGRIEIVLRGFRVARAGRIQAIAQEMGYALHSREGRSNDVVRLHFIRDDNPWPAGAPRRHRPGSPRAAPAAAGGVRPPSPPPPPQPPPPLPPHLRADGQRGR
ncbi:hypothetical protein ACFQV4_09705 [Streptomyces thermocarboxydus]